MFNAYPAARIEGCVTFARIVFAGAVFTNKHKHAKKMYTHIHGNVMYVRCHTIGTAISIVTPLTKKYDPLHRFLSRSPNHPPINVPSSPVPSRTPPKIVVG